MTQNIHGPAFGNLRKAGRKTIGFGVHVKLVEHRRGALRWQVFRVTGQLLELIHLRRGKQETGVHPALSPVSGADPRQAPPLLQYLQSLAVLDFNDAGGPRGQILPHVHGCGPRIGNPYRGLIRSVRFPGSAARRGCDQQEERAKNQ
jgi:hypothetical protein